MQVDSKAVRYTKNDQFLATNAAGNVAYIGLIELGDVAFHFRVPFLVQVLRNVPRAAIFHTLHELLLEHLYLPSFSNS
jgi:hypothetical protein